MDDGQESPNGEALPTSDQTDENIFMFWPNIIGYVRIILAVVSLHYMPLHPRTCSLVYSISCLLDAADGYAARYFDQSTKFGTVLDMVTDRCTTTCLLVFLSIAYPAHSVWFQLLICLDLSSHYMHMYATLAMGGRGQSHKNIDKKKSWIMHLYYTNRTVLFLVCAANELCFLALYLLAFEPTNTVQTLSKQGQSATIADPYALGTESNQLLQDPHSASAMELARVNKIDSDIPLYLFYITLLPMAFKQWVNIVQMVQASRSLAEGDRNDRKRRRL